jgi:hypothetical protein
MIDDSAITHLHFPMKLTMFHYYTRYQGKSSTPGMQECEKIPGHAMNIVKAAVLYRFCAKLRGPPEASIAAVELCDQQFYISCPS